MNEVTLTKMPYYNVRTGQYDLLASSPEDWADYVPQGIGRNLYLLLVQMGKTPEDAALLVLSKAAGVELPK